LTAEQNRQAESDSHRIGDWDQTEKPMRYEALFVAMMFALLFAFFSYLALRRPADVDEGFFLVFGKSIFEHGRHVYLDFFSPQMPLLPYLFGFIMNIFGYTWAAARIVCAVLAAGIGAIVCRYALARTRSYVFAASVAALYCFAPFIFILFTCARIPVLNTFFLLLSIILLKPVKARSSPMLYALSGFFLGLSIDARLYIAAVVPVLVFHIIKAERGGVRHAVYYFLGGVALALMVNLPFFVANPGQYVWDVLLIHSVKTSGGLIGSFGQKWDHVRQLLFDYPHTRPTLYLGYVMVFFAYLCRQLVRRVPLSEWNPAFHVAGAVFLVSLLPTPTFGRYFSVPVPFFMMLAVDLVYYLFEAARTARARRTMVGILGIGAVMFAYLAVGKIQFTIFEGNNLPGSMPTEGGKEDWHLQNVREVSRAIDRLVQPDAAVLSLWPGYLLEADVNIMPRTENMTMLELEDRIPDEIKPLTQTITDAEIREGIRSKQIDLLVYGNSIAPHVGEYKRLLIENGYTVAERVGGISLFLSPEYQRHGPAEPVE